LTVRLRRFDLKVISFESLLAEVLDRLTSPNPFDQAVLECPMPIRSRR